MKTRTKNIVKRGIGTLLALVMLLGLLPMNLLAADTMTIKVTANADTSNPTVVGVYQKPANYFTEMTSFEVTYVSTDGVYDIYEATPSASGQLIVEAYVPGETNKVAKTVNAGASVTLDLQPQAAWSTGGKYADDMYTNLDDSGTLNLEVGEDFALDTFRAWQALGSSVTANLFIEPEFYFEVFGDSIEIERIGNYGREQLRITAKEAGVSVIKITYGSAEFNGMEYNAIDPRNTYAVVVNVDGGADFDTGINTGDVVVRNDFDTFYFDKTIGSRDFTFTPEAGSSVRVHAPLDAATDWNTDWTTATTDGTSFTVPLVDGRNIIEITNNGSTRYQLVKARGVFVAVENLSTPDEDIALGETVRITIQGIESPITKMAGVYNPGFSQKPYLRYTAGAASVKSDAAGQYEPLSKTFVIDYAMMDADENVLNGQIQGGGGFWGIGLDLGAHRDIPMEGISASTGDNGLAPSMGEIFFGALPEITLDVDSTRSAVSPFTEDGWLVVESTGGTSVNDALLKILQDKVGGLGLESITKLKITGPMTIWDFSNGAAATSQGPLSGSSTAGSTNPARFAMLSNLVELDLSGVTGEFPDQALRNLPELERLRLPEVFTSRSDRNMMHTLPKLAAVVCGDAPYVEGVIDLTGFIGTSFTPRVFNTLGSTLPLKVVFPGGIDVPDYFFGGIPLLTEIVFTGDALGSISQISAFAADIRTTAVAYIPAGADSSQLIPKYFDEVKFISAYDADPAIAAARDALEDAIEAFELEYDVNPGYSDFMWDALMQAIDDAKAIAAYDDYRVTEASFAGAETAIEAIVVALVPDKTALKQAIADANGYAESDWTEASWVDFTAALDTARAVYYDKEADLNEVVAAYGNLADAINGLEEPLGNKDWLNGYIALYGDATESDFTANSDWAAFTAAMAEAKAVALLSNATMREVNAVEETFAAALGSVVYIGDLRHDINNAKSLTQASYTSATWSVLANALSAAEAVLAKADAVKTEVDTAAFALRQAAMALETASAGGNGSGGVTPTRSVTVTFRLIGDTKHNDIESHGKYITWVATKSYTFNNVDRITVYDLFTRALDDAGLGYQGADSNYISAIQAPGVLGGFWLNEFDNGPNSGWMYTVDGTHPGYGLKNEYLYNGNKVIWHYTDDFTQETSFEGNTPIYNNRWLEAADVNPTANNAGGAGNGADALKQEISGNVGTVNGVTTAVVNNGAVSDALEAVKKNLALPNNANATGEIVLHVEGAATAKTVQVKVPAAAVKAIADAENVVFTLESNLGAVTLDSKTLAGIAKGAAANAEVTISVAAAQKAGMADAQAAVAGNNVAFELTVMVGDKEVQNFAGEVMVFLPYASKATAGKMAVYHIAGDGTLAVMKDAKYDEDRQGFVFTTTHFSVFLIAEKDLAEAANEPEAAEWVNPFADVAAIDWFYGAVKYACENSLMNGTGATTFAPQTAMTRAMVVQVLYNYAGKPAVEAANPFTDVADGQWYTDAVAWANAEGVVSGYGNGSFGPNDEITREQMAVILYNFAKMQGLDVSATTDVSAYADAADIADWALAAMQWANAEGLINGRSATALAPKGMALRAEIASVLMSFIENVVK